MANETIFSPGVLTREQDSTFLPPAGVLVADVAFIGPTVKGPVEEPTIVSSYNEYKAIFGSTFYSGSTAEEYLTSIAVKNYFSQGGNAALITRVVTGSFTPATSTNILASGSGNSFELKTIGKGVIYNNSGSENADNSLVSGSVDNIRWEITGVDENKGTFTVLIRRGDDNLKNKTILESFLVSLDPESPEYIERVIGNQYTQVNSSDPADIYVESIGAYPNKSKYVRVSAVNKPTPHYLDNSGSINSVPGSPTTFYNEYLPKTASGSFNGATGTLYGATQALYFDAISATNTQGLTAGNYSNALAILANKDEYQFKVVSAPGVTKQTLSGTVDSLISLAESRQDCIAIVDLTAYSGSITDAVTQADALDSSYGAAYWPWVQTISETGKAVWIPAGTVIPGVLAFSDKASAPWVSPAGLTRGGLGTVTQASRKLTTNQRSTLYKANINPVASFPGEGVVVYGQKTLQKKASALDRVNVRRLLIEIRGYLSSVARGLVFEQNTEATRDRFLSIVNPYLKSVVERQGLYAFQVIMDETNNTADVIDRNTLVGQIRLQPTRAIEYIILDFTVEPTGATFGA